MCIASIINHYLSLKQNVKTHHADVGISTCGQCPLMVPRSDRSSTGQAEAQPEDSVHPEEEDLQDPDGDQL